jgi:hypothetical protein
MAISRFKTSTLSQSLPKHKKIRAGYDWNLDENAQFLRIAAPLNSVLGFNDYSASIKGSGTNRVGTAENGAVISTATSKYYGSSLHLGLMADDRKVLFGVSSDLNIGSSDFTIEGWWYFTSNTVGYQCLASHAGDTGDQQNGWILYMESNNQLTFAATNNGGWPLGVGAGLSPATNQWHHISVTRQSNNTRMFLNGSQVGSTSTAVVNISLPSSRELRIGNYQFFPGEEKGFQGYAQDFRLYIGVAKYTTNFTVPDKIWLGA